MKTNIGSKPQRIRAASVRGVVLAAVVALTGCQAAVDQGSGSSATPKKGGTLVVAQIGDVQPSKAVADRAENHTWRGNVFEVLIKFDSKMQPQPLLAKKWTLASDGLSMDIVLRDDVTFQTGRKMTADDVKFSFQQAADPVNASQVGFIGEQISAIDVTGQYSLKLTFANPVSNIFDFFDRTAIVDKDTFAGLKDGSKVIGTGPFKWVSWKPGAQLVLERYAGYRDAKKTNLDKIEYTIIKDPTALISALRSGRAQIAYGLSNADALVFDKNKQYTLNNAGGTIYDLGLNVTVAPFDNEKVRQAIGYAIDRDRINKQVFGGQGTVTDLFWSPSEPGYSNKLAGHFTYDPEKAKKMIEDAGATGAMIEIAAHPIIPQGVYEIVQNNLKAIGLKPTPVFIDAAAFGARQVAGTLGPAFILLHGQVGYTAGTLIGALPPLRKKNPSHFSSPEYNDLKSALLAATTTDQKSKALENLSEYLLAQAFVVPILQAPNVVVASSSVHGMVYSNFTLWAANAFLTK